MAAYYPSRPRAAEALGQLSVPENFLLENAGRQETTGQQNTNVVVDTIEAGTGLISAIGDVFLGKGDDNQTTPPPAEPDPLAQATPWLIGAGALTVGVIILARSRK